jgi:hypothetical protein
MGKTYWQAIREADEPASANRSVAERALLLGSTDPLVAPTWWSGLRAASLLLSLSRQCISKPSLQ